MPRQATAHRSTKTHRFIAAEPEPLPPLVAEWVEQLRAARLAKRTLTISPGSVTKFAKEMGVSPVTACRDDLIEWFNEHELEWSHNSAARHYACLRIWFTWLVTEGHRNDNPALQMKKINPKRKPPRPISNPELRALLAMPRMHTTTRAMILLAAFAGLRCCEIAEVKGKDLDLNMERPVLWVKGKGGTHKSVPLHPRLVKIAASMPRGPQYWFPSAERPKKPMRADSVSSTIARAMTRAGVAGTPHSLRHWYGSRMLQNGADARTVQECMRHESIMSTMIYTEVLDDRRHSAV